MNLIRSGSVPRNLASIPVEFAVIHYTVEDLPNALRVLADPAGSVSTHLLIAPDGTIYELVSCWDGIAYRAQHAGKSRWNADGSVWEGFNEFSIGIELVNRNGNVFSFSDAQYNAVAASLCRLQVVYPALQSPHRILGHEHIAGWRGKVDPGHCFDWSRLYSIVYPDSSQPKRVPLCPTVLLPVLNQFVPMEPSDPQIANRYWRALSHLLETSVALLHEPSQ
jgi:N-acetylmuramoyl-L-alanine amidase